MRVPRATYRLQINADFTLEDAERLVPYLDALGISHVYLSPIFEAQPDSTHGYDVTDPTSVRAAIGGEPALRRLSQSLSFRGMGIVLDIVPNHMAASILNPWWADLLENGVASPFARCFDLGWRPTQERSLVVLPILGGELDEVLERGELRIALGASGLELRYHEHRLPLAPPSYATALGLLSAREPAGITNRFGDSAARTALSLLAGLESGNGAASHERAAEARDAFLLALDASPELRRAVRSRLEAVDALPAAKRRPILESLLSKQSYRLRDWRIATREVSYRRFFDITQLVGVRVEDPDVFDASHQLVRRCVEQGLVSGLRVDHVDGLLDPAGYLHRLRRSCPVYVIVEKILARDETTPADWDTEGATGYEFLTVLEGWFMMPDGYDRLAAEYARAVDEPRTFRAIALEKKRYVLDHLFGGELAVLTRDVAALVPSGTDPSAIRDVLREITAQLDVYRTYVTGAGVSTEDRRRIERAASATSAELPARQQSLLERIRSLLLLDVHPADRAAALRFVMRWQQVTGPAMAKGYEDTALYNYHALVSANEVGGDPGAPTTSTSALHDFLAARADATPGALNAGSTHDTKRSEDVRTRLDVLTELADEWSKLLDVWLRSHEREDPADTPSAADDVLLLQTLIGSWPLHAEPDSTYRERIVQYMRKAAREAKARTRWRDPDAAYEAALERRVDAWLDGAAPELMARVRELALRAAFPGALNSLAQMLVRIAAPGVPDLYQGTELWRFALVDPDNRRPVDYALRERVLAALQPALEQPSADAARELLRSWPDGRVKMLVAAAALRHRRSVPELFAGGEYLPLEASGPKAAHLLGFARRRGAEWSVAATCRWLARELPFSPEAPRMPPAAFWEATRLALPDVAPGAWRDTFTGERFESNSGLDAARLFGVLPVALLYPAD